MASTTHSDINSSEKNTYDQRLDRALELLTAILNGEKPHVRLGELGKDNDQFFIEQLKEMYRDGQIQEPPAYFVRVARDPKSQQLAPSVLGEWISGKGKEPHLAFNTEYHAITADMAAYPDKLCTLPPMDKVIISGMNENGMPLTRDMDHSTLLQRKLHGRGFVRDHFDVLGAALERHQQKPERYEGESEGVKPPKGSLQEKLLRLGESNKIIIMPPAGNLQSLYELLWLMRYRRQHPTMHEPPVYVPMNGDFWKYMLDERWGVAAGLSAKSTERQRELAPGILHARSELDLLQHVAKPQHTIDHASPLDGLRNKPRKIQNSNGEWHTVHPTLLVGSKTMEKVGDTRINLHGSGILVKQFDALANFNNPPEKSGTYAANCVEKADAVAQAFYRKQTEIGAAAMRDLLIGNGIDPDCCISISEDSAMHMRDPRIANAMRRLRSFMQVDGTVIEQSMLQHLGVPSHLQSHDHATPGPDLAPYANGALGPQRLFESINTCIEEENERIGQKNDAIHHRLSSGEVLGDEKESHLEDYINRGMIHTSVVALRKLYVGKDIAEEKQHERPIIFSGSYESTIDSQPRPADIGKDAVGIPKSPPMIGNYLVPVEQGSARLPLTDLLLNDAQKTLQAQMKPLRQKLDMFDEIAATTQLSTKQKWERRGLRKQYGSLQREWELLRYETFEPLSEMQIVERDGVAAALNVGPRAASIGTLRTYFGLPDAKTMWKRSRDTLVQAVDLTASNVVALPTMLPLLEGDWKHTIHHLMTSTSALLFQPGNAMKEASSLSSYLFAMCSVLDDKFLLPQVKDTPIIFQKDPATGLHGHEGFLALYDEFRRYSMVNDQLRIAVREVSSTQEAAQLCHEAEQNRWHGTEKLQSANNNLRQDVVSSKPVPKRRIAVFCSATAKNEPLNNDAYAIAYNLAKAAGEREGTAIVTGAGNREMMGSAFNGCRDAGGYNFGCSTPDIINVEADKPDEFVSKFDHYHEAANIYERMDWMIRQSDSFVVLPGGIGTLQEFALLLMLRERNDPMMDGKPIILYNPTIDAPAQASSADKGSHDEVRFFDGVIRLYGQRELENGAAAKPGESHDHAAQRLGEAALQKLGVTLAHTQQQAIELADRLTPEKNWRAQEERPASGAKKTSVSRP